MGLVFVFVIVILKGKIINLKGKIITQENIKLIFIFKHLVMDWATD